MSGPPTIHPDLHGSRCLRSASTRIRRPVSASVRTKAISCSKAQSCGGRLESTNFEPTGQSAKCTDTPVKSL